MSRRTLSRSTGEQGIDKSTRTSPGMYLIKHFRPGGFLSWPRSGLINQSLGAENVVCPGGTAPIVAWQKCLEKRSPKEPSRRVRYDRGTANPKGLSRRNVRPRTEGSYLRIQEIQRLRLKASNLESLDMTPTAGPNRWSLRPGGTA
jgi:hypothetical protein